MMLDIAESVIRKTNREQPADAVLRQELKTQHALTPKDAAAITQAVFAYFRWFGWLKHTALLHAQIEQGLHLASRYLRDPQSFANAELIARAVPSWLHSEMEISADWLRALQAEPKLWLRARSGHGTQLAKRLRNARPFGTGPLADALEYLGRQDLFRTPEFQAGEFEVQDVSSQAVGWVCQPAAGETWWDACAGEGGKLLHLSDLMQNRGLIWASDRTPWRLQRLKRRAARAKVFNYRVAPWDGGTKLPTRTKFDGVLVDAPCSGVGTWHRNPHARWTTTVDDVKELARMQEQLLTHVSASVKPAGKLIYAVCTLTRSETNEVADTFEKAFPEFRPWPMLNPLSPGSAALPRLQLWPQEFRGNGMFIAGWVKRTN